MKVRKLINDKEQNEEFERQYSRKKPVEKFDSA